MQSGGLQVNCQHFPQQHVVFPLDVVLSVRLQTQTLALSVRLRHGSFRHLRIHTAPHGLQLVMVSCLCLLAKKPLVGHVAGH